MLDGISFDWGTTRTAKEAVEPAGPAAEPQQRKLAVAPRKRVHKADPEGRSASRRAIEPHPLLPRAAAVAFWAAPPAAVEPDAGSTAAPGAGGPVMRDSAGRTTPVRVTTFDDESVIKSNF